MIKPKRLKKGDKVAVVSLSWGGLGDEALIHKFYIAKERPSPDFVKRTLRTLAAQGILKVLNGIIVGKPQAEQYYKEYKGAILKVVAEEEKLVDLPIIYNVNFGHAMPIGIIPYGVKAEIDCDNKRIVLLKVRQKNKKGNIVQTVCSGDIAF